MTDPSINLTDHANLTWLWIFLGVAALLVTIIIVWGGCNQYKNIKMNINAGETQHEIDSHGQSTRPYRRLNELLNSTGTVSLSCPTTTTSLPKANEGDLP